MIDLAGSVALVTGASRGIGLAVSEALQSEGAHVVRLARGLGAHEGERYTDIKCDVTSPDEVARAVEQVLRRPGVPDIVVNNAGVFLMKPIAETEVAEFERQLKVNLRGPFLIIRSLLPHLIRKGAAHIVNIGSVADHVPYAGNAAYAASKYGLRGLHEVIRRELAGTDVRLTLVSPGPTDTDVWESFDEGSSGDVLDRSQMLRPEDVGRAVLFAVSQPPRVNVDLIRLGPAG